MVAFLIVLYLIVACCSAVLSLWESRQDYPIDVPYLACMFVAWPIAIVVWVVDRIDWRNIRNPFWKAGTP